jgi:hypothetical protein
MDAPSGTGRTPEKPGGFRSQPLWLRVLLIVSLAALAAGVVRCSFETTAPLAPAGTEAT